MSLPNISIPAVNIPFDIPTLMHPPIVHFAIAIPVLIVVFELINIFLNNKTIKVISTILMVVMIGVFFAAYLTGITDGKAAIDNGFGAMDDLKEHKLFGIYLVYISVFVLLMKLLSLTINRTGFKVFYVLILFGFLALVFHQGEEGGELVYKHAANVKAQNDEFDDDDEEETTKAVEKKEETTKKPVVKEEETKKEETTNHEKTETPKTTEKAEEHKSILDTNTSAVKKEVEKKAEEVKEKIVEKTKEIEEKVTDLNKTEH